MLVITLILGTLIAVASCQKLPRFFVHRENVTMSGYSSGGAMAQMVQISYPSMFKGIAVFSHTFYRCGPPNGDIDDWDRYCTTLFNFTDSEMWNTSTVHEDMKHYLEMGLIDDPVNLKNKRLYVYTGTRNFLFTPTQSLKILEVYEPYIQNPAAIKTRVQDAVQLLPSNTYGAPCRESAEDNEHIGNCGFSGVTEAINFILYENSQSYDAYRKPPKARGTLSSFNQTEFLRALKKHNMDDIGYYYVPRTCQASGGGNRAPRKCHLHIYFHGCFTGREFSQERHVTNTGLLEIAERKGIVMIFPQAKSSDENPIGCWDTFGMAGLYYATQRGPQVTAIRRMLDRALGSS